MNQVRRFGALALIAVVSALLVMSLTVAESLRSKEDTPQGDAVTKEAAEAAAYKQAAVEACSLVSRQSPEKLSSLFGALYSSETRDGLFAAQDGMNPFPAVAHLFRVNALGRQAAEDFGFPYSPIGFTDGCTSRLITYDGEMRHGVTVHTCKEAEEQMTAGKMDDAGRELAADECTAFCEAQGESCTLKQATIAASTVERACYEFKGDNPMPAMIKRHLVERGQALCLQRPNPAECGPCLEGDAEACARVAEKTFTLLDGNEVKISEQGSVLCSCVETA